MFNNMGFGNSIPPIDELKKIYDEKIVELEGSEDRNDITKLVSLKSSYLLIELYQNPHGIYDIYKDFINDLRLYGYHITADCIMNFVGATLYSNNMINQPYDSYSVLMQLTTFAHTIFNAMLKDLEIGLDPCPPLENL